jgi:hypothetical protein
MTIRSAGERKSNSRRADPRLILVAVGLALLDLLALAQRMDVPIRGQRTVPDACSVRPPASRQVRSEAAALGDVIYGD